MITAATVCGVDATTAMGIAALWNDAIDEMLHTLDRTIADLTDKVHHPATFGCEPTACEKGCLLVLCEDTRFWLVDIESGEVEFDVVGAFDRVEDYLDCRRQSEHDEDWLYGPVYRLAAELADQIKALRDART